MQVGVKPKIKGNEVLMERYVYLYRDDDGNYQWTASIREAELFSNSTYFQIEVIYEAI
jgi:hypothetical protein